MALAMVAAVILIFGFMFDETTVKRCRILFVDRFQQKYGSLNCCSLSSCYNCDDIIATAADIADKIIYDELYR